MIDQTQILKIVNYKIKPMIEMEIGEKVTREDLENLSRGISEVTILGKKIVIDNDDQNKILAYLLKLYGFNEADHIFIRGMGIFNNEQEYELEKENWFYYSKHREYLLEKVYPNTPEIVYSLDEETDQIIKRIPKPDGDLDTYAIRGMVIGHVQSGKTAHFTHLISKAASIGYKFIVVLSGMTNTLRLQTQNRLNKELIGDTTGVVDKSSLIQWLPYESKYRSLTTLQRPYSSDDGDFKVPVSDLKLQFNNDDVTIAIVKKLARINRGRRNKQQYFQSILGSLISWVENDQSLSEKDRPPILIIDDEADQASVDGSNDDCDPTTINHAIRKLLSLFPKSVYVGYTATPFANVFINKDGEYLGLPDLYPKDFIYALPEPKAYFGTNKFFNLLSDGISIIKNVQDSERANINDASIAEVTDGLGKAILDFIFCILIKDSRNDPRLKSMLIHTDHRNDQQNIVCGKVKLFLKNVVNGDFLAIYEKFNQYVKDSEVISRKVGVLHSYPVYDLNHFKDDFIKVVNDLKSEHDSQLLNIKVVNGLNESLNFDNLDNNVICIGGNLLSRGVTVEGLCVSYYLRDTTKYDTLLQMARWFGYRNGYEDLLRVYTTKNIQKSFEYLIHVEHDLRSEIQRYIEEGVTPETFAPKVRAHTRMLPTSKMGVSEKTKAYSQKIIQTIYFENTYEKLYENYVCAQKIVKDNLNKMVKRSEEKPFLLQGLDIHLLYEFIKSYNYHEKNTFDIDDILEYISVRENDEIESFDILVSSLKKPKENSLLQKIGDIDINPVGRNLRRINDQNYTEINLGVISDSNDIELSKNSTKLTLILYFIDGINSNAFNGTYFGLMDKKVDFNPVGYALVFPKTARRLDENDYYQQVFV